MTGSAVAPDLVRLGERPRLVPYLRSLWDRREFVLNLPLGELRAQNMNTVLGGAWHLLNPLLLIAVYWLVFGVILDVNRGVDNFVAFLSCGIFTFFYTRKCVQTGAKSIVDNLGLIRSIRFPRVVLPTAAVIGETVALVPAVAAMLVLVVATGGQPRATWLLLAPIFVIQCSFNLGLALTVARLTDHFRDVQQLVPYTMTIWLYVSGIFFEATTYLDGDALTVFRLNPVYAFVTLVRGAVLEGVTSSLLWLIALGWAAVSLIAGLLFFRAREQEYGRG